MQRSTRIHEIVATLARAALGWMLAGVVWASLVAAATACPFCSAETRTLTEEFDLSDAAVLARLASPADADLDSGDAKFQVVKVLSGEAALGGKREIETVFFGEPDPEQVFLITGVGVDYTQWATPLPLSAAGIEYLGRLAGLPDGGADRLAFFQEYLEHDDPLLAQDSYEEFARAPYGDVQELATRMHHDRLVAWIKDPETNPTRRRLYLTMLGVCGTDADLPMLEEMITSGYERERPFVEPLVYGGLAMGGPLELPTWTEFVKLDERRKKLGLDALLGCYMVLRGPSGLDLIEKQLVTPKNVDYSQLFSTLLALRFLGEETDIVPRERLLAVVRLLLDNPDIADQVIPDLARWEDWSVLERLVATFKSPNASGYIRPPIVAYLLAAAEQPAPVGTRAAAALVELEQVDPEVVKRARGAMAFGFLARARTVDPAPGATRPETVAAETKEPEELAAAELPPDPAKFHQPAAAAITPAGAEGDVNTKTGGSDQTAANSPAAAANEGSSNALASAAAPPANAAPAAAPPAAEAGPAPGVNKLVVIGLPLGAMLLLAGVYWLILRGGAA